MTLFNASACIWTCMNQGVVWECPYSNNSTIFGLFGPRSNRCFWRLLSNLFLFHRAFLAAKNKVRMTSQMSSSNWHHCAWKKLWGQAVDSNSLYSHYIANGHLSSLIPCLAARECLSDWNLYLNREPHRIPPTPNHLCAITHHGTHTNSTKQLRLKHLKPSLTTFPTHPDSWSAIDPFRISS